MNSYTGFAEIYDQAMNEIPYKEWSDYLTDQLREYGIRDGLVAELGCGTGTMTELLAEAGYDMIGLDASEEMLAEAMEKRSDSGHEEILYLHQDMRSFELYGTVRAVISVCDSINYILRKQELVQVFSLVNNYLDPGGIFLFDLKTIHYFRDVVGNRSFGENGEDYSLIWENVFEEESRINTYAVTIFIPAEDGLSEREDELHEQRGYELAEIREALELAGMKFLAAYDGNTKNPATEQSERIYIVAQEQGKQKG